MLHLAGQLVRGGVREQAPRQALPRGSAPPPAPFPGGHTGGAGPAAPGSTERQAAPGGESRFAPRTRENAGEERGREERNGERGGRRGEGT